MSCFNFIFTRTSTQHIDVLDYYREVDILGVFRYRNTYPMCLDLLSSQRIDVKPLITHRFAFSQQDVKDAFETSAKGGNAIKVMFNL